MLLLAAALGVGALGTVQAQAGAGPENALSPTDAWSALQAGEIVWYAFRYDGSGSEVKVRLDVEPLGGASLAVWTPEGIEQCALGLAVETVQITY
ncbi:MAG: hypothetical protein JXA93_01360 [Anaerolineae bacterium]|nr:hypothetical protein [Anaerolineae bacterium]